MRADGRAHRHARPPMATAKGRARSLTKVPACTHGRRRRVVWPDALRHVGRTADSAVVFVAGGKGPNAADAMYYRPRQRIEPDDLPDDALRAQANAEANRRLHRVCVWPDGLSRPLIGALLRHELEHAGNASTWGARPRGVAR